MKRSPTFGSIALTLVVAAGLAACGDDDTAGAGAGAGGGATAAGSELCPAPSSSLATAAKQEGTVNLNGTVVVTQMNALQSAFKSKYGVEVSYVASSGQVLLAKLQSERAAGVSSMDVFVGGGGTAVTLEKNGWIAPLKPVLDPALLDDSKWLAGKPQWIDPAQEKVLKLSNFLNTFITVNTKSVGADEIKTWKDLLDPKWKGKIVTDDPRDAGSAANDAAVLLDTFGESFVTDLYVGQRATISVDRTAQVDGVARGTFAIGLSLNPTNVAKAIDQGLPLRRVVPTDAPLHMLSGNGLMAIADKAPHPNAAKLLVNWLACPEGNQAFNQAALTPSTLKGVPVAPGVPADVVPQPGVTYFDAENWDFLVKDKVEVQNKMKALIAAAPK